MEITCPHCQSRFEAVTRRATCQSCAAQLDVWALLGGHPGSQTIPAESVSTSPLAPASQPGVASPAVNSADPYSTRYEPPEGVLDLPPTDLGFDRPQEPDAVLDSYFSTLPREFAGTIGKPEYALPLATLGRLDEDSDVSVGRSNRRLIWWMAATIGLLSAASAFLFITRCGAPEASEVVSDTRSSASQAAGQPSSAGPAVPAPSSAPTVSQASTPVFNSTAKTAQPTQNDTASGAKREALEPSLPTDATRARAVYPQTQTGRFTLQVAAKPTEREAKELAERLIDHGLDARILKANVLVSGTTEQRTWYRVRVGAFATRANASQYGEQLKRAGNIDDFYVADSRK